MLECRYCKEDTEIDGLCEKCSDLFEEVNRKELEKGDKIKKKIKKLRKLKYNLLKRKTNKIYYKKCCFVRLAKAVKSRGISDVTASGLWRIAKKQKLICPITGHKLTNENISPDHTVSLFKGGSNNLENIQLVTKQANISKYTMSMDEFISFCAQVTEHNKNRV